MLAQSDPGNNCRALTAEEKELVIFMLQDNCDLLSKIQKKLDNYRVVPLDDGAMGSIQVVSNSSLRQKLGCTPSEAEYLDSDGVAVYVSLNLDEVNEFFELEFWKVDFSPRLKYPKKEDLKLRTSSSA